MLCHEWHEVKPKGSLILFGVCQHLGHLS
jgi:hypothetical protein